MAEIVKARGHRFKITNEGGGYRKIYVEDAAEPGGWLFLRSVRPDQDAAHMIESGAESGPIHKWADRFSRPGAKDMMAASEQAIALYRKLNSSGTAITSNNWREWERLASSAMKMPDFTPAGQSESLHDLANEVGIEIQALKSRASRPGAKARFKVEDRFYFGKGRKERFADDRLTKFLEVYKRNEDNNLHSENVLLLAKFIGSGDQVAQAQRILNRQNRSLDGITEKSYEERKHLNRRLLLLFRRRYPQVSI